MNTHSLVQGSPSWHAYRAEHDNASEIAAVLGLSKTTTRTELLRIKHAGMEKEFSDWVQRNVLDRGHDVEGNVRPLVEALIGEDLYPVTCSEGRLSASLDGLTMDGAIAFECKQWNAEISAQVAAGVMPEQHIPQCQQILMVTGAEKVIFGVGDGTPEKLLTLDVLPDPVWFERIRAGWAQFHADLAAYVPPAVTVEAIGHTPETLPALRIEVTGMVTASNLADYKAHALAVFAGINRKLTTDQHFADADKVVKWCGDVESRLAAARQHALSQTESIDALFRTIDDISAEARRVRLDLDKLVKARKEAVRGEIVAEGVKALAEHINALNARIGNAYMPISAMGADFGGAIRGKKSLDSMRDAVGTTLANAKIEASATADRIHANLATLNELAFGYKFLFADVAHVVLKANDDCRALVENRIAAHQAEVALKEEAQRQRIWQEEVDKLAREQEAADRLRIAQELDAAVMARDAANAAIEQASQPATKALQVVEKGGQDDFDNWRQGGTSLPAGEVVPMTRPTLRLGQIAERLGFALTADFLRQLGFEPSARDKAGMLYHEYEFIRIGAALVNHINSACELSM